MLHKEWEALGPIDGTISFRSVGRLTTNGGAQSAVAMARVLAEESLHVVFDVRQMTGYDTGARSA